MNPVTLRISNFAGKPVKGKAWLLTLAGTIC